MSYPKCVECGAVNGLQVCDFYNCEFDVCPAHMVKCRGCDQQYCAQHALRVLDQDGYCDECPGLTDEQVEAQFAKAHPELAKRDAA